MSYAELFCAVASRNMIQKTTLIIFSTVKDYLPLSKNRKHINFMYVNSFKILKMDYYNIH